MLNSRWRSFSADVADICPDRVLGQGQRRPAFRTQLCGESAGTSYGDSSPGMEVLRVQARVLSLGATRPPVSTATTVMRLLVFPMAQKRRMKLN